MDEITPEQGVVENQPVDEPKKNRFVSVFHTFFSTFRYLKIFGIAVFLMILLSPGIYYGLYINKRPSPNKIPKKMVMTPTPSLTPTPSVPTTTSSPAIHAVKPTTTPTSQPTLTNTPVPQLSVGVSGTVFSDDNCNGFKDGNESIISNASVTIFYNNPPTYQIVGSLTTDGSGNFSWSKNIYQNDSYPVQISVLSPSGYKSDPKQGAFSLVLNASNPHGSWTIGQVPNADVSSMCNN